jgi:hypothetical protein
VIAAGWAIDDNVAAEFGKAFYEAMMNGETFGKATLLARQAAYRANPTAAHLAPISVTATQTIGCAPTRGANVEMARRVLSRFPKPSKP